MDLKEIAEAYQLVYEKKKLDPVGKEDDDVDNDGDVDSSDKYLKKRRAAIADAMGKDGDKEEEEEKKSKKDVKEAYGKKKKKKSHDCASKVKHEEYGIGNPVKGMHDLDESGKVAHYDVLFDHGVEKNVPVTSLEILEEGMHEHVIYDDKDKEVLWSNPTKDLMSAYYSMYEHHQKDADGNVIPHEDEEEVKEEIDLSFVDELSEEELDTLVEEVVYDLLDEGVELDAIEGAFTVYLEEAKVTYGSAPDYVSPEEKMTAAVKKRKEEKAKASKEKAEKFKKSVGKAVTKMKAKMHGGMADYAGKRGLIPAKTKMKKPDGRSKAYRGEGGKDALAKDKAKFAKAKNRKQSSSNIKVSMMGGGAKDTRSKLRSAVFKDVKDRVGKKTSDVKSGIGKATKSVIDAPKKVGQGIRKGVGKGIEKGSSFAEKGFSTLKKLGKKMQEQGGELDMFDTVTAYLIDEGFAKDFDHAQRIMITLDSSLIEEVHAEQMQLLEAYGQNKPGYGKGGDFSKVPTSLHGKLKVGEYDIKHNTEAGKRFKAGNPAYKKV